MRRLRPLLIVLMGLSWLPGPTRAEPKDLELLFVGDVSFAGRRLPRRGPIGDDQNPFKGVKGRFAQADLVVVNAEGLLTAKRPASYSEARLDIGASPRWAPMFRAAGVDLVGLANNHSWDGGSAAVLENRGHIARTGVAVYGARGTAAQATAPHILRSAKGACRVAIVSATLKSNRRPRKGAHVAYYRGAKGLAALGEQVGALRRDGCFVILSVHWGREAIHRPPRSVVAAAHALVDAGAGLVIGHHPHVLQGVEHYRGAPIVYSLGNFVFTNRDPDKRETGLLSVRMTTRGPAAVTELALVPAVIDPRGFFPRPARPRERARTVERLRRWSRRLNTRVKAIDDRAVFSPLATE